MDPGAHLKVRALHNAFFSAANSAQASTDAGGERKAAAGPQGGDKEKLFLTKAVQGAVVTRFPPEASGYLHIGHAKAAYINRMVADRYGGKMLFRFDDTNPTKEMEQFEEAIIQDLATLGVAFDAGPTYSSDYFELMTQKAEELIRCGLAYCDKTPREEMQKCRFDGVATAYRNLSVEDNMRMWREMQEGTADGQLTCLRAKISVNDTNKAMRDPVMYRVNLTPHVRQGVTYKVYPTYDFCCPVVDSVEGVTHALRTNEYHDRNDQYYWFCDALKLRKPRVEDFSRLNMEYSLMSKRKLTALVKSGRVDGWDDPRFPTVRALLRRGMQIDALRQFVAEQGMSKTVNFMQWSKLWFYNTQILDATCPRYSAVADPLKVRCTVIDQPSMEKYTRPLHKKVPHLGEKVCYKSDTIYLDAEDVALLREKDEITLMDWCNAVISDIQRCEVDNALMCVSATLALRPNGDVKKTKHKLTWIPETEMSVRLTLNEYDHILTKQKTEPDDNVDELIAPTSIYTQNALGEAALAPVTKGTTLQIERRGYYIVDKDDGMHKTLIAIPDGRDKINHLSAKAQHLKSQTKKASAAEELAAKRAAKAAKKSAQKLSGSNKNK